MIDAKYLAEKPRKILCMKTKGKIVRTWRESKGMSTIDLAKRVGTSRQNIENLEKDDVGQPRYLHKLAEVMGYASTDDLLALQDPPQTPVQRRRSTFGRALQTMLEAGNPPATIQRLRQHLLVHTPTRREIVGELLLKLAKDPDNEELALEIAAQLEPPAEESMAA